MTDIQRIRGDKLLQESPSPGGRFILTAWLVAGSAITDDGVLVRCAEHATGRERNVFWQYHAGDVAIKWLDDDSVLINDHELTLTDDTYRSVVRK